MLDRLSKVGGLVALVVLAGLLLARLTGADTLTLTTFTSGQTGAQIMSTLNSNNSAITSGWTKITDINVKEGMAASEKIDGDKINLTSSCGAGDNAPCITTAMIDPNSTFVAAAASSGAVTGFGPMRAHAQATPDLTMKVEAGTYLIGDTVYFYAGGSSPALIRPTTSPRIALLAIDANGVFTDGDGSAGVWLYGDEAASPAPPPIPPGVAPIVYVYARTSATCDEIRDTDNASDCYLYREARPILNTSGSRGYQSSSDYLEDFAVIRDPIGAGSNSLWHALVNEAGCPRSSALPAGPYLRCSETGAAASGLRAADTIGQYPALHAFLNFGVTYSLEFRVKWVDENSANWQFGFSNTDSTNPPTANHISIVDAVSGTSFRLEACENASCVTNGSDIAWTPGNWNVIEIRAASSLAECYLNGRLVGSIATASNIPDTNCDGAGDDCSLRPYFRAKPAAGTHEYQIDYIRFKAMPPFWAP